MIDIGIQTILERFPNAKRDTLIPMLQEVQEEQAISLNRLLLRSAGI